MRVMIISVFFAITACSPLPQLAQRYNPHTQVGLFSTNFQTIDVQFKALMQARPVITVDDTGRAIFGLQTSVIRDDGNFPHINEAYSFGTKLHYRKSDRRRIDCSDGCEREEIGVILLGETAFRAYADRGLTFQLVGKRGVYTGTLDAGVFAVAYGAATEAGFTSIPN